MHDTSLPRAYKTAHVRPHHAMGHATVFTYNIPVEQSAHHATGHGAEFHDRA